MADKYNGPEYGRLLNEAGVRRISRSARLKFGRKSSIKIGTWNVRSMFQPGKIHNTIQEMKRLNISILGISEMRWPQSGKCTIDGYTIFYAGEDGPHHRNGVGVIVSEDVAKTVLNFTPISDRIAILQIQGDPIDMNIIQVYAPTTGCSEEVIEIFYQELNRLTEQLKNNNVTVVMGDFNAKVGYGKEGYTVGNFGLGTRNERGNQLIQFCIENKLAIMNTFFKLPKRRLYTWKSPADSQFNIVRNQIDYFMIGQRYKNTVKSVKTFPGADVNSDHNLLLAEIRIRFKKVPRVQQPTRIDIDKLKINQIRQEVSESLENEFEALQTELGIEEKWIEFKTITNNLIRSKLKYDRPVKRQSWMTNDILDLMEERRRYKNRNDTKYKELHRELRKKIRQTKAEWFSKECTEIEMYDKNYDMFHLHKKVKEMAGICRYKGTNSLNDDNGNIIFDVKEKLTRWKQYVEELFNDERPINHGVIDASTGPPIMKREIERAIENAKTRKATGPDEIPTEILKLLRENGLQLLVSLFNSIYDRGVIPSDWLKSIFITIPKRSNAKECSDHRMISLMSHVLKLFLRVLHNRMYKKLEQHISATQFGFRNGLGTREALFSIQVLIQRCRDVEVDVFLCFIDFEKAFDRVQHDKMIEILKSTGIDDKDLRFVANLYWQQNATVKVNNKMTENIEIHRGVRQGCILSPMIFNIYSEKIFDEALTGSKEGIKVNGVLINNLRYADDTVIIADSREDLQILINKVTEACNKYGLNLNIKKTKYMSVSKSSIDDRTCKVNGVPLERAHSITYLGCTLDEDWDHTTEVKCRIEKARAAYTRLKKVLSSHDIHMGIRTRMVRCYVFSVLLYGVEAWTLTENLLKRLEAFEMWVYRRMLRISWMDRVTNVEVMSRMKKAKEIIIEVKTRKLAYFGHIMRHPERYHLLHVIVQGKISGKRGPGRRRTSWLKNLRDWFEINTPSLFRAAKDRDNIARFIADVR